MDVKTTKEIFAYYQEAMTDLDDRWVALDSVGKDFPEKEYAEWLLARFISDGVASEGDALPTELDDDISSIEFDSARWGFSRGVLAGFKEREELKDHIGIIEIELSEKRLASAELKKRLRELGLKFDHSDKTCKCVCCQVRKELLELSK